MKSHSVSVVVEGRGIRVSPDPLVMTSNDEIKWACSSSHRFMVTDPGLSPVACWLMTRPQHHNGRRLTVGSSTRCRWKDPSVRLGPEVVVEHPPSTPEP